MTRKTFCLFLLVAPLLALAVGCVFGENEGSIEDLELQGCRIVNEGAHFQVTLRNNGQVMLNLTIESDIGFVDYDGYRIYLMLNPDEEKFLGFHAPQLEIEKKTVVITFLLLAENESKYFRVEVVDDGILEKYEQWAIMENLKTLFLVGLVIAEGLIIAKMKLNKKKERRHR